MSAAEDELREQLKAIVTRNGKSGRIPEILELELDDLEKLIAAHDKALLDRVRTEVINTSKEIYIVKGKEAETERYCEIREELRNEQLEKLNALLPNGGVEGEHHD